MRIDRIETFATSDVAFVRVTTDDGAHGWGQVAPYHAALTAEVLHRQVAPHVLGADALQPEPLGARVLEAEHTFPGSYLNRALAGVDTALWDLRGRLEGRSVCELVGGTPGPVTAYASSMRRDIEPAAEARRLAALQERTGSRRSSSASAGSAGADYYPWQDGLYDPPLTVAGGAVAMPAGPGWGVEINPAWLRSAAHRVSGRPS